MVRLRHPRRAVAVAIAAVAALTLSGCASGSSGSNAASGATSGSAASGGGTSASGPSASGTSGASEQGSGTVDSSRQSSTGDAAQQVSLVYDWSGVDFEAVPLAVGKAEGIFAKHHIDLKLILPPSDSTTVKLVESGKGDIGFTTTADVVITRGQGSNIVSIGNYSQENNWGLVARPGEKISLDDLKGAKIGVFSDNWTQAMMPFVLKAAGLTKSDVSEVNFKDDDVAPLLANKLDVTTNTANFAIAQVKEATGKKPTVMLADKFDAPDVPIWVYAASQKWLDGHGDTAKDFMAAIKQAARWAIDHPEDAVNDFEKVYPDNGSSHTYNLTGWKATADVMDGPEGLLTQRKSQWSELTDALQAVGILDKASDPSSYYTNKYLPSGG